MIFVLQYVAVPDIAAGLSTAEIDHYPRNLARRAEDGVLEPGFITPLRPSALRPE